MKILFKYTSKSRPELFKRGLLSIIDNCESKDYHILITTESNDVTMHTYSQIQLVNGNENISWKTGISKNKIDAINRDVNEFDYDWDVLVNMSDDMIFTQKGFDNVIRNSFDNLDQCLHFPDGNAGDKLMTLSIVGRKYYQRFNYIYHPDYVSLWADNEAMEVAKILGCYKYIDKQIFEHLHPAFNKAPNDAQYIYTESFYNIDYQTFLKRKQNGFPNNKY